MGKRFTGDVKRLQTLLLLWFSTYPGSPPGFMPNPFAQADTGLNDCCRRITERRVMAPSRLAKSGKRIRPKSERPNGLEGSIPSAATR